MARRPHVQMLPAALRAWRSERDLTQEQLAKRAGCSASLIALIETSRRQPSLPTATDIATALRVPLAALAVLPDASPAESSAEVEAVA